MLRHFMEAKGVNQAAVHPRRGIPKSMISEVLAGKKAVLSGKKRFSQKRFGSWWRILGLACWRGTCDALQSPRTSWEQVFNFARAMQDSHETDAALNRLVVQDVLPDCESTEAGPISWDGFADEWMTSQHPKRAFKLIDEFVRGSFAALGDIEPNLQKVVASRIRPYDSRHY
jgi:hypothetical protein